MTAAKRILCLAATTTVAGLVIFFGTSALAQPLVSGGLVIYYDFDTFTNTVMDGSGNGFNAKVQDGTRKVLDQPFELNTTGVISNETTTVKRGTGAIRFTQSTVPGEDPVFIDMDGGVISATADGIGGTALDLPAETGAISMAAWVYATGYGGFGDGSGDFTVFQGASGGHGVPHFQIQSGTGAIRLTIRNDAGQNLVDSNGTGTSGGQPQTGHPVPNQPDVTANGAAPTPWPINEWHHVAITFDKNANAGAGQLDMYYDGTIIKTMGNTGPGTTIGPWQLRAFSDYYDGLAIGTVYDNASSRLTRGVVDEAYIFNRKLTDAEVLTLYNITPPGLEGDYNEDGSVDAADYVLGRKFPENFGGDPAWYNTWRQNFGRTGAPGLGSAAVPEPTGLSLLLICLSFFVGKRNR
jgi:hypothetical protein